MSEEDVVLEAFTEFLNAVEAGIAAARQLIKTTKVGWDPDKIKWVEAQGAKGPYEKSDDFDNLEYKALVKDLATHNGKLTHSGLFYWLFENGATVGRKKRGKREEAKLKAGEKIAESFFPEDLRSMFSFEETADMVVIRPRQYLGSEGFAKAASIVREAGGSYISEGKNS